jgi:hypothetical protein
MNSFTKHFLWVVLLSQYFNTLAQDHPASTTKENPIHLENVYVKYDSGKVILSWQADTQKLENIFIYYSIERSGNGIGFHTIKLNQQKDAPIFVDEFPLNGLSYYRVRKIISSKNKTDFLFSKEFIVKNETREAQ